MNTIEKDSYRSFLHYLWSAFNGNSQALFRFSMNALIRECWIIKMNTVHVLLTAIVIDCYCDWLLLLLTVIAIDCYCYWLLLVLTVIDCCLSWCAGEEQREAMRKDVLELKRNMNDEVREKDAIAKTSEELRNVVKKNEGDKIELSRALTDTRQRAAGE